MSPTISPSAPARRCTDTAEVRMDGALDHPREDPHHRSADAVSRDALVALYRREYAGMVRLAVLLVGEEETAEDVVQDAFAAVWRRRGRLRDPARVGGYLRRCVVNGARSALRRRSAAGRSGPGARTDLERLDPAAEVGALARVRRGAVLDALARLPRRQREVLALRYYLGLGEAEIAETLRISRGSVKTHASRGAAALRTMLEEER